MPYVSLRNLGLAGLIKDRPTYDLEENAFNEVSNVRFFNGTAQKSSIPVERFSINADSVWMEVYLELGVPKYVYATVDELYEINPGTGVSDNVSRTVGGAYTSTTGWQSMVWSESSIFNNGVDVPQIFEPSDSDFKDLTNWPANLQCQVMRPFKNFLFALNITTAGVNNPTAYRWSNESETGAIPNTWVPDTDNLSGGNILTAEDGEIIDGLELGDVLILYTRQSAHEISFIGGTFVMGQRKFTDNGLVNRNAVCAFDHYHFCVSNWSIYTHDGHTVKHIADQRVRDFLFESTTNTDSIRCVHLASTKECVIYFESSGSGNGEATKAIIWCYRYDTWTLIDLPGVNCIVNAADSPISLTYDDYDVSGVTYNQETKTYSQLLNVSITTATYFLTTATDTIDDFDTQFGAGLSFKVERTGLDFDQLLQTPTNSIKFISELLPQITGSGDVDITLGFSSSPEGAVTWGDPSTYTIGTDYKADFRNSGRYPAWRFEGSGEGNFQLSGMDFNVVIDGER
tara:strand:+ start:45 stop:1586 length:1542 start_codon:yes stop_codon:yes gene_type:complete